MLSPNSILHQGRYRITRHIGETAAGSLYEAHDNLFGQDVIIHEGPDPRTGGPKVVDRDADSRQFTAHFNRLRSLSYEAVASLRDHFYHADRKYIVSEPVNGRTVAQMSGETFIRMDPPTVLRGIGTIVDAFERLSASDRTLTYFRSDPANVRITPEGDFKYLYFGSISAGETASRNAAQESLSESPFMPLEVIWPGLDLASQTAISKSFDERSLEVLELSPDFRSDIATFGAIAYFLITGVLPNGALERSIEVLDGKSDPLVPPHLVDPSVSSEVSDVVMKAMCLNREDRFDGFDSFLLHLRSLAPNAVPATSTSDEFFDEIDLLEIPGAVPVYATAPAAFANTSAQAVRAPAQVPETVTLEATAVTAVDIAEEGEFVTLSPAATYSPESGLFSSHAAKKSWFLTPAAIGAVVLVIVGIGGWFAFSSFTAEKASAVNQVDTRSTMSSDAPKQEPSPISSLGEPAAAEPVSPTPEIVRPADETKEPSGAPLLGSPRTRPAVADSRPRVESKPTASETGPKPKKKVTVDDLIRDN